MSKKESSYSTKAPFSYSTMYQEWRRLVLTNPSAAHAVTERHSRHWLGAQYDEIQDAIKRSRAEFNPFDDFE